MTTTKRIAKFLLLIIVCLTLISCKTIVKYEYIYPTLPDFDIEAPVNPELTPIPDGATSDEALEIMYVNIIKLIDVNEKHTIYEETFLDFYSEIQKSLQDADKGE